MKWKSKLEETILRQKLGQIIEVGVAMTEEFLTSGGNPNEYPPGDRPATKTIA